MNADKEWEICTLAAAAAGRTLMDVTTGPRHGFIASCMLLITMSIVAEIEKDKVLQMVSSLWDDYIAAQDRPIQ